MYKHYVQRNTRASGGFLPSQIAQFENFPKVTVSSIPTIYLVELGGGFNASLINQWCDTNGYPHPNLSSVGVQGAANSYTGNPDSADVEVVLDICCAIGIVAYMTGKAANIVVVFAPNSDSGFNAALDYVGKQGNCTCGISWGSDEHNYSSSTLQVMDLTMKAGAANGVTYCAAAGDNGASDGDSGLNADYPGSSPWCVSCGGTTISVNNNQIVSEVVWNAGGGATGGGYSVLETVPTWQNGFVPSGKGRGVPDLSLDADPSSGWSIATFGVVGGTSAVAPSMAAFFAVASAVKGSAVGYVNPVLYANEPTCFKDITVGNNSGYAASTGWDAASGLGVPIGDKLLAALVGNVTVPPPVTPPPVLPPPVVPPPVLPPPIVPPPPVVPPVLTLNKVLSDVVNLTNATMANVEGRSYYFVRPYLEAADAQLVANFHKLFLSYGAHEMTFEHKALLKAAGLSHDLVEKAASVGWSLSDILQLIIKNAPQMVAVLEDVLKLLPVKTV